MACRERVVTPRRVLMIAFHFPPFAGSSGVQRTLRFVQHLPSLGWEPVVLTVNPRVYETVSPDLQKEIPSGTLVRRAFALNAAKDLAIGGKYFAASARPDRWSSWRFDGIRQGMKLISAFKPQAIWSTYPIPTAHVIAAELKKRTELPWVADFRDPMAQDGYPSDPQTWNSFVQIEQRTLREASASVFTTPGAVRTYQARYPDCASRVHLIENGYDEMSFLAAEKSGLVGSALRPGKLTILHSGIVYQEERNPVALFQALARLKEVGVLQRLIIRFRASGQDDLLRSLAGQFNVVDNVEILPALPYVEALQEMLRADALLVLQASNCNEQIPAKLYEYLRANRPVLALTDPEGDTAATVWQAGLNWLARLSSADEIFDLFCEAVAAFDEKREGTPDPEAVARSERRSRATQLAHLFGSLA